MTGPSVPPPEGDPGDGSPTVVEPADADVQPRQGRRAPRWVGWVVGVVVLMVIGGAIGASAAIRTDQVLFEPGSVRGTAGLVEVSGTKSYPMKGDVLFATVSVRQATLFDRVFRRPLDDTLRFTPIDEVYPDGDKAAVDAANESAMDDSKTVASVVALQHLGRKVTFTGDGVAIVEVAPEMPADGLLKAGDLLVGADGQRLELTDDLHRILEGKKPGDSVKLSVVRGGAPSSTSPHGEDGKKTGGKDDGKDDGADTDPPAEQSADEESVIVPLVAADDGRPVMGVQVADYNLDVELPIDISFDSGEVTGPSAGLAWTLAIVDELTPDDLTMGQRVAATGTIGPDGAVGPIGGLPQKTAAVRRAGAELFLVPEGLPKEDLVQAKQIAGDEVDLVEVATLDEAIDEIEEFVGA